jgi:hypothetical protein
MTADIRDKQYLTHEDIAALNFIKRPSRYFFRNHFREGLRSRLLQVLQLSDIALETAGIIQGDIRMFPVAHPVAMLRILKKKFSSRSEVQKEIDHYKILQRGLPKFHYAVSSEFMVDYKRGHQKDILLCGLQEYVAGESLDPWQGDALLKIIGFMKNAPEGTLETLLDNLASFVDRIKTIVRRTGAIPDLAGVGNLIMTPSGGIKLVDINNISKLSTDHHIPIDDKGYPVSDKSIQALYRMETRILGRSINPANKPYCFFLDRRRMKEVGELEKIFHQTTAPSVNYPSAK